MAEAALPRLRSGQMQTLRMLAAQEAQRTSRVDREGALMALARMLGFPAAPGAGGRLRRLPQDMAQGAPVVGDIASGVADWAQENPLDAGALAVSPVPVLGDLAGLANDLRHYATDPESRTWGNYALSAAGLLPLVPGVAGAGGKVADSLPVGQNQVVGATTAGKETAMTSVRDLVRPVEDIISDLRKRGWGASRQYANTGTIYLNVSPVPGRNFRIRVSDHGKRLFETDNDYFVTRLAERKWRDGDNFDIEMDAEKLRQAISEIESEFGK